MSSKTLCFAGLFFFVGAMAQAGAETPASTAPEAKGVATLERAGAEEAARKRLSEGGSSPIVVPCLDAAGKVMDWHECAEVEAHLEELVRIGEAKKKLRGLEAESGDPLPALPVPRSESPAPTIRDTGKIASKPKEAGEDLRVSGLFGETARIIWKGQSMTVRAGSRLPGGGEIESVSGEGIEVRLPGSRPKKITFVGGTDLE